ncbi:TPA: hypothetical protein OTR37_003869 [Aeromonas dhakensis]|nr:hypothetical protein [Aeromonas dhakensis]
MSFDRFFVQMEVEKLIGCEDLNKWSSYKQQFLSFQLNQKQANDLNELLKKDAALLYYKAIFSIADAISNISYGRHSWSVVKLYYAIFYLMRCKMATQGYAFVKNKGIFTLKMQPSEVPLRRDQGKYNGETISGDHKTTIATYVSEYKTIDKLQSNTIDGVCVYDFVMEMRNQVNYRERTFHEPKVRYFHKNLFDRQKLKIQIDTYMSDPEYIYCFMEEHCCLAVPLKLAMEVKNDLYNYLSAEPFDNSMRVEIRKLLQEANVHKISALRGLYFFNK